MDFSNKAQQTNVLEQVYARYDELVGEYDYVSKVDIVDELGMEYPEYCNLNNQPHGDYLATPSYKTYMYKFEWNNANCGHETTFPKRKILIVSGTHGNETAAPFNTYLLMRRMCACEDANLFKIFASYDIYVIPCLSGYGMYHLTRVNANGVNLNRNYPIEKWTKSGEGTLDYSGDSAGSEFETQLVMAVTNLLKPHVAIDAHNYGTQDAQFYTEVTLMEHLPMTYQSFTDCSYAFIKGLPSYFGNKFKLFRNINLIVASPLGVQSVREGKTSRWWLEAGIPMPSTIEISWGINFIDGVYANSSKDMYGADFFSVSEYTLRNLLIRYCEYDLYNY